MKHSKTLLTKVALTASILLGLDFVCASGATPAAAQTYVCPPGYYFLAGYGCYPLSGYSYYYAAPPPPPAYYYAPYPSYPAFGLSFQFGGRDHDRGDRGHDFDRGRH